MSFDVWATPGTQPSSGWAADPAPTVLPPKGEPRLKRDAGTFLAIVVALVLVAPVAGLVWAAVAPHYTVVFAQGEATYPNIESTKAFIGADGSYVVVLVVMGLVSGALAWLLARRSGPWTVAALALGGVLAALVVARVGLIPGRAEAFEAIKAKQGRVELFLGARADDSSRLRAPWAAVAWPVASLFAFLVPAYVRPEELD